MRALLPISMTVLLLSGFTLGDRMPLLNPYELVRASGMSFLPISGTRFIADQAMFGKWAIAAGWGVWILAGALLAALIARVWNIVR